MGEKDFFSVFKPKTAFILGLVGGLLLLCTIGFFVLLAKATSGDDNLFTKNNNLATMVFEISHFVFYVNLKYQHSKRH